MANLKDNTQNVQLTQKPLFPKETPENASKEIIAWNKLWYFFRDNYNLMLLDEHITDILIAVDNYHKSISNAPNKEQNTPNPTPY